MSTKVSAFKRYVHDHFVPESSTDPNSQRRLRGQLEQIDYTAFASNREVIRNLLGHVETQQFQRIAVAAAHARAQWVKESLVMTEKGHLDPAQLERLTFLRKQFEELTEVYEAMRRMVERGYLSYRPSAG